MGNTLLLLRNGFKLATANDCISLGYVTFLFMLFVGGALTPAFTVIIIAGGLGSAVGANYTATITAMIFVTAIYCAVCVYTKPKTQLRFSLFMTIVFAFVATIIVVGGGIFLFREVIPAGTFHDFYLFIIFLGVLVLAALLHIKELPILGHIVWYFMAYPALQFLLPLYAVCNIVDQSWGTRENVVAQKASSEPNGVSEALPTESTDPEEIEERERLRGLEAVKVIGSTRSNLPSIITTNEFGHSNPSFIPDDDIDEKKTSACTDDASMTNEREERTKDDSLSEDESVTKSNSNLFRQFGIEDVVDQSASRSLYQRDEFAFWLSLKNSHIEKDLGKGGPEQQQKLLKGVIKLRNSILGVLLILNVIWLALFTTMYIVYFEPGFTWGIDDIFSMTFILSFYGIIVFLLLVGMIIHRVSTLGRALIIYLYGDSKPVWIHQRNTKDTKHCDEAL